MGMCFTLGGDTGIAVGKSNFGTLGGGAGIPVGKFICGTIRVVTRAEQNIFVNSCNAAICLSTICGIGVAGCRLLIATIKSSAVHAAASLDDNWGILAVEGKKSTMSAILSECVLGMYAL
eukprot:8502830-Ditylum_brightwellii.AAC.1